MRITKKDIKDLLNFINKEDENMRLYDASPYKVIDDIKNEVKKLLDK